MNILSSLSLLIGVMPAFGHVTILLLCLQDVENHKRLCSNHFISVVLFMFYRTLKRCKKRKFHWRRKFVNWKS